MTDFHGDVPVNLVFLECLQGIFRPGWEGPGWETWDHKAVMLKVFPHVRESALQPVCGRAQGEISCEKHGKVSQICYTSEEKKGGLGVKLHIRNSQNVFS